MIRLAKLTDYAFVMLSSFAAQEDRLHTARDIAGETGLPLPTVSKLLKVLAKHDILAAHRGVKGGYRLARPRGEITFLEIIAALEGPFAMTECISEGAEDCDCEVLARGCPTRSHWERINEAVRQALGGITLAGLNGTGKKLEQEACVRPGTGVEGAGCACGGHSHGLAEGLLVHGAGEACACSMKTEGNEVKKA